MGVALLILLSLLTPPKGFGLKLSDPPAALYDGTRGTANPDAQVAHLKFLLWTLNRLPKTPAGIPETPSERKPSDRDLPVRPNHAHHGFLRFDVLRRGLRRPGGSLERGLLVRSRGGPLRRGSAT